MHSYLRSSTSSLRILPSNLDNPKGRTPSKSLRARPMYHRYRQFVKSGFSLLATILQSRPSLYRESSRCKYPLRLQRIDEIRPRIPQSFHLLLRLPLGPIIPPASPPLRILLLQQRILQYAPPKQKDRQIAQDDAVSLPVQRRVFGLVDVRADDAVEISPADDNAQGYAALINALGIIRRPRYNICNGWINSKG